MKPLRGGSEFTCLGGNPPRDSCQMGLPLDTWLRLLVWMSIGLVIYFAYGRWNSRPHKEKMAAEKAV